MGFLNQNYGILNKITAKQNERNKLNSNSLLGNESG